jgi:hypothetical protein
VLFLALGVQVCLCASPGSAAEGKRPELILPLGHTSWVMSVALSSDGKRLLTGSGDKTARLWDVDSGKTVHTFQGHTDPVFSVALSSDGMRVLTGSDDRTARLWDVESGNTLQIFLGHTHWVRSVALSSDGKRVLTGSDDQTARLWDVESGKTLQTFKGHTDPVTSVALGSDGKRLLTGSDEQTARLWDVESGKSVQTFQGHTSSVSAIAFGPGNNFLVTASWDGTTTIWRPGRDRPVFSFLHARDEWILWTPEGYYTCSPGGEYLIAWKIDDPDAPHGYRIVSPEQFRKMFRRPDLFRHLLNELDLSRALAKADQETGPHEGVRNIKDAPAPFVVLSSPEPREVIESDECKITAAARFSRDNPVTSLTILLNGRELRDDGNRSLSKRFTDLKKTQVRAVWKVKIPPGEHSLEIQADTRLGTTDTSPAITITRQERKPALPRLFVYGVGVGAEDYQKSELRTAGVKYCREDVRRFTEAMKRHARSLYAGIEVLGPTDGVPTRANIIDGFLDLAEKVQASPNAVTIILMAGHGDTRRGTFYFLCADADDRKPAVNGLSTLQLKEALGKIPGRVVLFMDACYSGAVGGDDTRDPSGLTDDLISELSAKGSGVAVITSSRGMQKSLSDRANKGGYFTLALVEALGGAASKCREGVVYLPAIYAYVSEKVKERTKDEKEGPQYPYASDLEKLSHKPVPISKP